MREFVNLMFDERTKSNRAAGEDPAAMDDFDPIEWRKARQPADAAAEKAVAKIRGDTKNEKPGERPVKKRPGATTSTTPTTSKKATPATWKASSAFKHWKPEWTTARDAKMKYTWNQERWKYWPGQQPREDPRANKGAGKGGKAGGKGRGKGPGKGGR
jgi:hypothetical protein